MSFNGYKKTFVMKSSYHLEVAAHKKKVENVNYLNYAYLRATRSQFADNKLIALHQSQPFYSDQFEPSTSLPLDTRILDFFLV